MDSDLISMFKSSITHWYVIRRERVEILPYIFFLCVSLVLCELESAIFNQRSPRKICFDDPILIIERLK